MMSYGGEMCSGYMQSYDSESWAWGAQQWGASYDQQYDQSYEQSYEPSYHEQVQYDLWNYPPQDVASATQMVTPMDGWSATPAAGPKVGSELLTEIRLAELKRLIDRDNDEMFKTNKDATSLDSNSHKAAAAPAFPEANASNMQKPSQAQDSEPASSLGTPHKALATFKPTTQEHGEMPVTIGEEVFVDSEPVEGWIYAVKRGSSPSRAGDQGWVPANALGIEAEIPGEENGVPKPHASAHASSVRGEGEPSRGRRGPRNRASQSVQCATEDSGAAGSSGRKAEAGAAASTGSKKSIEDEPWHQHGNWWSKQRHLKDSASNAAAKDMRQRDVEDRRGGQSSSSNAARSGAALAEARRSDPRERKTQPSRRQASSWNQDYWSSTAATSSSTVQKDKENSSSRKGSGRGGGAKGSKGTDRGRGGKAGGGKAPPRPAERPARERPALNTLLDRLEKPLVAPKPASST